MLRVVTPENTTYYEEMRAKLAEKVKRGSLVEILAIVDPVVVIDGSCLIRTGYVYIEKQYGTEMQFFCISVQNNKLYFAMSGKKWRWDQPLPRITV